MNLIGQFLLFGSPGLEREGTYQASEMKSVDESDLRGVFSTSGWLIPKVVLSLLYV